MNTEEYYKQIHGTDYLKRFSACQKILNIHKIPLKIHEIRQVFPYILSKDIYELGISENERLALAERNLKNFINGYGIEQDETKLTANDLNEALLDECYLESPDIERIKKLTDLGADIKAKDKDGETAFMYAVKNEDLILMEFFLSNGADVNSWYPCRRGEEYSETVWLRSLKYASAEYVELMMKYSANLEETDSNNNNVLHIYCDGTPDIAVIKKFIAGGVEINARNSAGYTPLHCLCRHVDKVKCIVFLLENGALVNIRDNRGQTPLHHACRQYQPTIKNVSSLLEAGADPNIKDEEGNTPLHAAVNGKNTRIIDSLMKHKADPFIRNNNGRTAYSIALDKGFIRIGRKISGAKADIDYKTRPEYTVLQRIKNQIITDLKNGKYEYYSNKEGYGEFRYQDGKFVYEWYEMGHDPPERKEFTSNADALKFLFESNHLRHQADTSEIDVFKDILEFLNDKNK
ncbi:MAG: ankyrin repeat domain-containing protein [Spirochaetales bacterium]|nr:ankyrin repeat domain-containing protein [Spirochaetales bacterium]